MIYRRPCLEMILSFPSFRPDPAGVGAFRFGSRQTIFSTFTDLILS
jgi:hypothetical protein